MPRSSYGNKISRSYSEKKVSVNALAATILGVFLILLHIWMLIWTVMEQGNLPLIGGAVESYLLLFGVFGLLWAVLSLDDEKTTGKFKGTGIVLNGIALVMSVAIMILGVMSY